MNKMVIVCAFIKTEHGLHLPLISKNRPSWQSGRLNLPGGHVKEGETIESAAHRELFEETDLRMYDTKLIGSIGGNNWAVFIVAGYALNPEDVKSKTDEQVVVYSAAGAITDHRLIDNLRYIIPKCIAGLDNYENLIR